MTGGAAALGLDARRFAAGFSVILWASYLCWLAGNNAYVAATPDKRAGFGIGWSLSLTGEAGFIVALAAEAFLVHQPLVAGAWMGLAVKTDGAAVASGAITEALLRAKAAAAGITYQEGWILMTTTTVKVFIDMFIGVWALVLALVWAYGIRKDEGRTVSARDLWERFPKFVLGYFVTFAALLGLVVARPGLLDAAKLTTAESNVFRVLFFVMTFFTIGLTSNFAKLREEGIGRLALVYVVCLFGFIVWIGLAVSWIFFAGMPRAGGQWPFVGSCSAG